MFNLHPTLAADTHVIGRFPLSLALLMDNQRLPWVILVPRRVGMREIYELNDRDQQQLLKESLLVSKQMMSEFTGDKLNVGAIGNLVPQLHIHHVVRYKYDPVWPQPVWGNIQAKPYTQVTRKQMLKHLRSLFMDADAGFESKSGLR